GHHDGTSRNDRRQRRAARPGAPPTPVAAGAASQRGGLPLPAAGVGAVRALPLVADRQRVPDQLPEGRPAQRPGLGRTRQLPDSDQRPALLPRVAQHAALHRAGARLRLPGAGRARDRDQRGPRQGLLPPGVLPAGGVAADRRAAALAVGLRPRTGAGQHRLGLGRTGEPGLAPVGGHGDPIDPGDHHLGRGRRGDPLLPGGAAGGTGQPLRRRRARWRWSLAPRDRHHDPPDPRRDAALPGRPGDRHDAALHRGLRPHQRRPEQRQRDRDAAPVPLRLRVQRVRERLGAGGADLPLPLRLLGRLPPDDVLQEGL
ncbi:MAG: hypothetical protein AVDCRST_MAG49-2648, partial [uncultured Thermomicrobiales bacterium]